MANFDFGLGSNDNGSNTNTPDNEPITDLDTGKLDDDKQDINNDSGNIDDKNPTNLPTNQPNDSDTPPGERSDLESGSTIEYDGAVYTVDANGNLLDKNNNIFKKSNEVDGWLKSFDNVEDVDDNGDENEININNLRKAIGLDITDEQGNALEFENSIDGIKSYVNSVIESQRDDNYNTAINTLYERFPFVEDVINYYVANGNSLNGYNEVPDRSGIEVIPNNEAQHEAIIRQAWAELARPGNVDNYLQYLKSSGLLESTAREELKALQDKDANYKEQISRQAQEVEEQQRAYLEEYWGAVANRVDSGKIAGYDIPETISINRNGQKLAVTRREFFNYLYQVDGEGKSMYERDVENTPYEQQLDDQLLRAYLMFTGGSYGDLVAMAANKDKVKNLRIVAKNSNKPSIRVNRNNANNKTKDIDLGYK